MKIQKHNKAFRKTQQQINTVKSMRLQAAAFGKAAIDMINNMLENREMSDYEPIDAITICRILYNANQCVELGLQVLLISLQLSNCRKPGFPKNPMVLPDEADRMRIVDCHDLFYIAGLILRGAEVYESREMYGKFLDDMEKLIAYLITYSPGYHVDDMSLLQLREQTKLIDRLANKEGLQQFSEKFGEVRMFLENQEMPSSIS